MRPAKTLVCPNCRGEIGLDDVHVATDTALCRRCGQRHSFSFLDGMADARTANPLMPPRWVKVEDDFGGARTIRYRRPSPLLFFLVPFTALWSGFSMWGIYIRPLLNDEVDGPGFLFGLPFLAGTVVLVSIIIFLLLGKWVIRLANGTGTVFVGVGPLGWTRRFVYDRTTLVSLTITSVQVNDVPQKGICLKTRDAQVVFGALFTDAAKAYIASLLAQTVEQR